MNRRSTGLGRLCRLPLVALLWALQLQATDGKREATGNLPAGAAYLERVPPGETPALFSPSVPSASNTLGRLAFSPDGREFFFRSDDATYSTMRMLVTRLADGAREDPAPVPFGSGFEESPEPSQSRDGKSPTVTAGFTGYVDQAPPGPTPRLFGLQTPPGFEFGPYVTDDRRLLFYSSSAAFARVDVHWIRFDALLETLRKR